MLRLLPLLLSLLAPGSALAWGKDGHRIVAEIASRLTSSAARAEAVYLLAGATVPVPVLDSSQPAGLFANLLAAAFAGLLVASILRQGPRGFLARLGLRGHGHDHHHPPGDEER